MVRKNGPWTIRSSVVKYKNPWICVTEDQVIRPDGKPGIFGTVTMKPGASVLAMDEKGMVYLTQEFRYAIGNNSIEVVSGAIDAGEEPLTAAQRELKEELGITAEEWIDLGLLNPFTSVVHSPARLFLARKLRFSETNREGTEIIRMMKIPFKEVVKMVTESKITHAQTAVLILKVKEWLSNSNG